MPVVADAKTCAAVPACDLGRYHNYPLPHPRSCPPWPYYIHQSSPLNLTVDSVIPLSLESFNMKICWQWSTYSSPRHTGPPCPRLPRYERPCTVSTNKMSDTGYGTPRTYIRRPLCAPPAETQVRGKSSNFHLLKLNHTSWHYILPYIRYISSVSPSLGSASLPEPYPSFSWRHLPYSI